jgi:hypothetical protein
MVPGHAPFLLSHCAVKKLALSNHETVDAIKPLVWQQEKPSNPQKMYHLF